MRDVDIFADRGADRNVRPGEQLVSAGTQDLKHRLVEPGDAPALGQPLHVGKPGDRGGNDVKVRWFDDPVVQNLHWVWDEGMIRRQELSFSEYAARLEARMTAEQVVAWWNVEPDAWMAESAALRDRIYPTPSERDGAGTPEAPFVMRYWYPYEWTPEMERRLQQSGIRTAAYLDWVFAGES